MNNYVITDFKKGEKYDVIFTFFAKGKGVSSASAFGEKVSAEDAKKIDKMVCELSKKYCGAIETVKEVQHD